MQRIPLDAQAREQLERAAAASTGRSATTLPVGHGHTPRQSVLALTAGTASAEHENPGDATLPVLRGRVQPTSGGSMQLTVVEAADR